VASLTLQVKSKAHKAKQTIKVVIILDIPIKVAQVIPTKVDQRIQIKVAGLLIPIKVVQDIRIKVADTVEILNLLLIKDTVAALKEDMIRVMVVEEVINLQVILPEDLVILQVVQDIPLQAIPHIRHLEQLYHIQAEM
jgi:hypothetical protein